MLLDIFSSEYKVGEGEWEGNMYLLASITLLSGLGALLLLRLALLEEGFWDEDLVLGGDAPVCSISCQSVHACGEIIPERRSAAQWSAGAHAFSADTPKSGRCVPSRAIQTKIFQSCHEMA